MQAPLTGCGNGVIEETEECDIGNMNGATCQTEGFRGGTLECETGCLFDMSGCFDTRFVDNGDGTVTDNQTCLMWEKKDSADGKQNLTNPHDVDNLYNWSSTVRSSAPSGGAFTDFLGKLNNCTSNDGRTVSGGFVGHCDWRMPTILELQTIADRNAAGCGSSSPCVYPVFNAGCTASCTVTSCSCTAAFRYWSATTVAIDPTDAWFVDFGDGRVDFGAGKGFGRHARAVGPCL